MINEKLRRLEIGEPRIETQINAATQDSSWFHHVLFKQLRDQSKQQHSEQTEPPSVNQAVADWETDLETMREVGKQLSRDYASLKNK